jgi:hypothetical protein
MVAECLVNNRLYNLQCRIRKQLIQNKLQGPAVPAAGRIVALDPGTKHIGIAVSDETQTIATPDRTIERRSWKKTLAVVKDILAQFDASPLLLVCR